MNKNFNKTGFSLTELSIVIVIIGLFFSSAVQLYEIYIIKQKFITTTNRLDDAKKALADFINKNGRLPCPAPLDAKPDTADYGAESCTASAGLFQVDGARDLDGVTGPDPVLIGTLPTRALNLPNISMQDGYKQRLLYAVTQSLTNSATFNRDNGAINIKDKSGNSVITPEGSGQFIVLSHGENGIGSYTNNGVVRRPCAGTALDVANCLNNASTFIYSTEISSKEGAGEYDDYAAYSTTSGSFKCPDGELQDGTEPNGTPICVKLGCATTEGLKALGYHDDKRISAPTFTPVKKNASSTTENTIVVVEAPVKVLMNMSFSTNYKTTGPGGGSVLIIPGSGERCCVGSIMTPSTTAGVNASCTCSEILEPGTHNITAQLQYFANTTPIPSDTVIKYTLLGICD